MKFRHFFIYLLISVSTMTFSLCTILGPAWPLIIKVIIMYVTFMLGHYFYFYSSPKGQCHRRSSDMKQGRHHV
jgi:fatty acid desaturase